FAELPLGDVAVIALELLLGLQLRAIVGKFFGAALAVLARTIRALVDRALGAGPNILAHAAIDFVLRILALAHRSLSGFVGPGVWKGGALYSAKPPSQTGTI